MNYLSKLLAIFLFMASFNLFSQEQEFIGENSELLIGKTVKFDPEMGLVDVYSDTNLTFKIFEKRFHTNPKKLVKYTFVVSGVFNPNRINHKGLILKNEELGEVYYPYYTKNNSEFYLLIQD
ncbi:MAG: hypothetical protein ACPGRC_08160 [Salibacteraceae bacterium]